MTNDFTIIFIDIDGTLVDDEKNISEETITVLRKLKENGIYIILTSGKPYKSIEAFSKQCFATPYLICSNGAIIKDIEKNIEIFSKELPKEISNHILNCANRHGIFVIATVSGNLVVDKREYGMAPENRDDIILVDSLQEYINSTTFPILKFTVINESKRKLESEMG